MGIFKTQIFHANATRPAWLVLSVIVLIVASSALHAAFLNAQFDRLNTQLFVLNKAIAELDAKLDRRVNSVIARSDVVVREQDTQSAELRLIHDGIADLRLSLEKRQTILMLLMGAETSRTASEVDQFER